MCSGSEEGSYSRLIDLVYNLTLGLRVIHKKKKVHTIPPRRVGSLWPSNIYIYIYIYKHTYMGK